MAPNVKSKMPDHSLLFARSFRNEKAMSTVKRDSVFCSNDAFIAVVWFKPFRNRNGAITAPENITNARTIKSFLFSPTSDFDVMPNDNIILFPNGKRRISERDTPANK
jgi:hypothetical protein